MAANGKQGHPEVVKILQKYLPGHRLAKAALFKYKPGSENAEPVKMTSEVKEALTTIATAYKRMKKINVYRIFRIKDDPLEYFLLIKSNKFTRQIFYSRVFPDFWSQAQVPRLDHDYARYISERTGLPHKTVVLDIAYTRKNIAISKEPDFNEWAFFNTEINEIFERMWRMKGIPERVKDKIPWQIHDYVGYGVTEEVRSDTYTSQRLQVAMLSLNMFLLATGGDERPEIRTMLKSFDELWKITRESEESRAMRIKKPKNYTD